MLLETPEFLSFFAVHKNPKNLEKISFALMHEEIAVSVQIHAMR